VQQLVVGVGQALADHLAGEHVQGSKERGRAVAFASRGSWCLHALFSWAARAGCGPGPGSGFSRPGRAPQPCRRVEPGRGTGLSSGPSSRPALRTRRATFTAPGSPPGPSKTNGCSNGQSRSTVGVLDARCWVAGVHQRLLPCRSIFAAWLSPFAMYVAFPRSDYYEDSVPSRDHQLTTSLPAPAHWRRGRADRDGSHVHSLTDRPVRCPAVPLQPRHKYAAGFPRGLPTGPPDRLRSRPGRPAPRRALLSGPYPPGWSRFMT
jgi:hypothetical protein